MKNENNNISQYFSKEPFTGYSPFPGQCDKYPELFIIKLESELYQLGATSPRLVTIFEALSKNEISVVQIQIEELSVLAGMSPKIAKQYSNGVLRLIAVVGLVFTVGEDSKISLYEVSEKLEKQVKKIFK